MAPQCVQSKLKIQFRLVVLKFKFLLKTCSLIELEAVTTRVRGRNSCFSINYILESHYLSRWVPWVANNHLMWGLLCELAVSTRMFWAAEWTQSILFSPDLTPKFRSLLVVVTMRDMRQQRWVGLTLRRRRRRRSSLSGSQKQCKDYANVVFGGVCSAWTQ